MKKENIVQNIDIEKDLHFVSQSDGLNIYYDIYIPQESQQNHSSKLYATNPTIIQIAHGMVEHKERYIWLCSQLARYGYVVVINDHRGHGKSIDSTHSWGEMGGISNAINDNKNGFNKAIDDLYSLTKIIRNKFPQHHFILFGHSMGSLIARGYLKIYGENLEGLILSGSPAYNAMLKIGINIASFLRLIGAKEWGKNFINSLSFGGFNRPFAKIDNNAKYSTGKFAWLSRDVDSVRAYCLDPACQFVFSLDSFIALFQGTLWVQEVLFEKSALMNKDLPKPPIYVISGESDTCGNFGKGVKKIAQLLRDYDFDVTLKLYKEARHEIFQEINKDEILSDMLEWIHNQKI